MAKRLTFTLGDQVFRLPFNTYDATTAPGVDDDTTEGYSAGSIVVDTVAEDAHICIVNTEGAALWKPITGTGSGGLPNAFSTVEVSGQDTLTATGADTLTLAAGDGVAITTDDSTNTVTISRSGDTVYTFVYDGFNTDVSPGTGKLIADTAFSDATEIVVSETDRDSADVSGDLAQITVGSTIRVQEDANPGTNYGVYTVTSVDVDTPSAGLITYGVTFLEGVGGLSDELIEVTMIATVPEPLPAGWSPLFAIENDGERRVLKLTGWTGGTDDAPTANVGEYLSSSGYTSTIGSATDIRGQAGTNGTNSDFVLVNGIIGNTTLSTTEAVLFTTTTTVAAGDRIDFDFRGQLVNDSGATRTYSFRIDIGAYNTGVQFSIINNANPRGIRFSGSVFLKSGNTDGHSELYLTAVTPNSVSQVTNSPWTTAGVDAGSGISGSVTVQIVAVSGNGATTQTTRGFCKITRTPAP